MSNYCLSRIDVLEKIAFPRNLELNCSDQNRCGRLGTLRSINFCPDWDELPVALGKDTESLTLCIGLSSYILDFRALGVSCSDENHIGLILLQALS